MNDPAPATPEADARLADVLDDYLAALQAGTAPPTDVLLARHPELAGDLAECLASLDLLRRAAAETEDTGQRTEVRGQRSEVREEPASSLLLTSDLWPLTSGSELGDFRLLRVVGRGGMGVVYEAEQVSRGRHVAVKILPFTAALNARQLQRFRHEAEAAARLRHPNIVPVYAVGCERDVPFYAMQFIEGQSLAQVIHQLRKTKSETRNSKSETTPKNQNPPSQTDAHSVSDLGDSALGLVSHFEFRISDFRVAAPLGVQAALALEYAHAEGVIHRDIKPANLLVDGRGQLWVTDFGLAHFPGNAGLTHTGDVLGTLRYMSPEQALGKRGAVDHRTDIYALAATLYELLTLEPAFLGRDREELLHQIAGQEPRPPRRLNPAVPADLETVVLKALAKDPPDRYATAQELADDLQSFLQGKSIRARRPTLAQRAAKWARRHKGAVAAAALGLLGAVAALAATTAVVWRKEAQARAAYRAEAAARAAEEEERRRAEQNLRLALQALDEVYLHVAERQFPRDLRREQEDRELLQKALTFYEEFVRQNGANPAVRRETARAYQRVGMIQQKLGHPDKAEEAFGQAVALLEPLAEESAAAEYRQDLALCLTSLGILREHSRRLAEAEQAHRRALTLLRQLAADSAGSPKARQDLAHSLSNLGVVLLKVGRRADTQALWQEALALREALAADFPAVTRYQRELASSQQNLASLFWRQGKAAEAERLLREALALYEKAAPDAADADHRAKMAGVQLTLGSVLANTGQVAEAEKVYSQAVAVCAQLAAEFPAVPDYRHDLALSQGYRAGVLDQLRRPQEADQAFAQALTLLEKLADDFPRLPRYREALAVTLINHGNFLKDAGRLPEAELAFRRSLALRQQLADERPGVPEYRQRLAYAHHNLADVLRRTGRLREAEAVYRRAEALLERLAAEAPDVPEYRQRLTVLRRDLDALLKETGQQPRGADPDKQ